MFNRIRSVVLRLLRVPHDPEPPFGAPGSVRIFRAGRNYYKLRVFRWALGQTGAVVGIAVSLTFLNWFKHDVESATLALEQAASSPAAVRDQTAASPRKPKRKNQVDLKAIAAKTPRWVIPLVEFLEFGGILFFIAQIPVTFAAVRLEYEMHWYIVTDRSLRIRTGLFKLTESTMSFANLQQVEVKQDPLQRLLGLANVQVQSAGGGGDQTETHRGDSLHTGIFHSVDNATEIRDLIQHRLRQFREAGLGDAEDRSMHVLSAEVQTAGVSSDSIAAALEILAEARALRQSLQSEA